MKENIQKILNATMHYKACSKALEIDSIDKAVKILFSPQGREFALKTGYPTIDVFRENAEDVVKIPGTYLDKKDVRVANTDVLAIGSTDVHVSISGTDKLYHIMAMHGANIKVEAKNYAVLTITSINSIVECVTDGTVSISFERI